MFGLSGVPDLSPGGAAAQKGFVTREPISIFSLRKRAKNQLLELLKKKMPDGFKIGAAVGEGDCFFDSIAQGLNELRDKGLVTASGRLNVKSLRESCKHYAQQVYQSEEDSWLENALKGEGRKLRKYIRNIEFSAREIESTGCGSKIKIIWGKPEIEGKMICEKYGVKVRIIEVRDEEIERFVTKSKVGTGNSSIIIVIYRNHFVPLLSNIEKNVKRSLKVCREEIYGNEMGLNSSSSSHSYIPSRLQDNENFSHKVNGYSRSPSRVDCKMSRKRRCSISDQDNKAPKRAHIEVNILNGVETELPCDEQNETNQDKLHRKRRLSVEDKDNNSPKRMHVDVKDTSKENLEFSTDLQYECRQNELDNAYQINGCIPYQLIRFMYQLDLLVLCSLREYIYKYKYPSVSLAFGDSEIDKFGNITLRYKAKSIHVQVENVEKYYTDNDISYSRLFTIKNGKQSFSMNNYFDSFVKHIISELNCLSNNIEYLIIYTNSGLDLTGEMKLKQSQSRSFYPFKFDSMNIENHSILKDFLFTNDNVTGRGFYQFSQNKATREELLKRLEFSSATRKKIKEGKLSPEFEKETKEAFLDKLVFAVNQPNREELNAIVKNEIRIQIKDNYIELQEKILYDLLAHKFHKKHKNDISKTMYSFSLLMSFLHDIFLNNSMFSINLKGKSCDRSNDITVRYKGRNTHIKIFNADSNIGYSHLFPSKTQESKNKFSVNKCFTLFIEELEKDENMRYFIIYTNTGLNLIEDKTLKKCQSKDFYPFKFNSISFQKKKYKILRDSSCIDKNYLYKFSQEETTKLLSLLNIPPSFQSKRQERLSNEDGNDIKKKFLKKLIFAVNQPHREEMNSIIRSEIENECNKVPYNYEELHEIALRWLESHESGPITKGIMEKLFFDIKSNRSSHQRIQSKEINKEIKFAKAVAGMEGTTVFNQFLYFFIKGEGIKYLEVLKRQEINLSTMSSILSKARSKAERAFKDLYDLWFDARGNKTEYLRTLEDERINLTNMSSILGGAGCDGAEAFKDLYDLWFDVKGNKTQYLITLEDERINLASMSNILHRAGCDGAEAFKDLYDLWFDAKGKKTQYLKTLEDKRINLTTMSSILSGARCGAAVAFNDLYDLWFDAKGNKTQYLKTLEDEKINLVNMSSILSGAGCDAAEAFKDLYDLWFDAEENKTLYLKALENEGINLRNISSILSGAGSKAGKAFKDLYHLWFDSKGNKTEYLKTLENEGVNLPNISSIFSRAGSKAEKAFKDLYHLWFNSKGNKTLYLKFLEDEGVDLPNMSSILNGAGSQAATAFKDLHNLWFDAKGNKTTYLKTLENEGVNLRNMSSILSGAGSKAGKAFKDLYHLWFDAKGNKTEYLKILEDEGVDLANMSSILNRAGSKAAKAFKDLHNLWFDAKGNKTTYLKTLENEGVNLRNMSSILNGAGSEAAKAFKDLHDLWFDAKGNKTTYLKALENEGVNLPNISSILSGAGSKAEKAFKGLYHLWFDAKGNKTDYLNILENEGINLLNICNILHGAGSMAGKAFKDLFGVWFDKQGNKTQHLKHFINKKDRKKNLTLHNLSSIFSRSGANARNAFEKFHNICFDDEGIRTQLLDDLYSVGFRPRHLCRLLCGSGSRAYSTLRKLHGIFFNGEGGRTELLDDLCRIGFKPRHLCRALCTVGARAYSTLRKLHSVSFNDEEKRMQILHDFITAGLRPSD